MPSIANPQGGTSEPWVLRQAPDAEHDVSPEFALRPSDALSRSQAHVAPAVLNAFIGGFNSRNAEIRRLREKILVLEQAKSALITENAVLANALVASKPVDAAIPKEPLASAPAAIDDFIGSIFPGDPQSSGLNDEFVAFDPAKGDVGAAGAAHAVTVASLPGRRILAMTLLALSGSLAGYGLHLLGTQTYSRATGIAITAICAGLVLMNIGWAFGRMRND